MGGGGESQKVSGGIERNAFVGSRDEVLQASPLLPLLLSSRIPQKPRKSRRKKYGKIENFPIAEETPPQLAQLATHFRTRTISTPTTNTTAANYDLYELCIEKESLKAK